MKFGRQNICAVRGRAVRRCRAQRRRGAQEEGKDHRRAERAPVVVQPDQKVEASAARAMDNYRRFLELQKTDPQLRAEALRRLGDLNMEAGEGERMAGEASTIDMQGAEAIKLYTSLLKSYPDYPRNDQVLYQLARAYETTGQPEKALTTLDEILRRYPQVAADGRSAVPPRRAAVLGAGIPRRRERLSIRGQQGRQGRLPLAEPVQARLVAVQAGPERREPAVVRGRARSHHAREGHARADSARQAAARQPRARRRHAARHGGHVLL